MPDTSTSSCVRPLVFTSLSARATESATVGCMRAGREAPTSSAMCSRRPALGLEASTRPTGSSTTKGIGSRSIDELKRLATIRASLATRACSTKRRSRSATRERSSATAMVSARTRWVGTRAPAAASGVSRPAPTIAPAERSPNSAPPPLTILRSLRAAIDAALSRVPAAHGALTDVVVSTRAAQRVPRRVQTAAVKLSG